MTHRMCSVEGCERVHRARGWCATHYSRWQCYGSPEKPVRIKPPCSVAECDRISYLKGMCRLHYMRNWQYGSTSKPIRPDKGCAATGCDSRHYCKGFCRLHYDRWLRTGGTTARPIEKATEQQPCRVCDGMPTGKTPSRLFCSIACYSIWRLHDGEYVTDGTCCDCGETYSFLAVARKRRKRSDATRCPACQMKRPTRWCMTAAEVAGRDGWTCAIGGERLDPNMKWPDPNVATVDHIIPRSRGGMMCRRFSSTPRILSFSLYRTTSSCSPPLTPRKDLKKSSMGK